MTQSPSDSSSQTSSQSLIEKIKQGVKKFVRQELNGRFLLVLFICFVGIRGFVVENFYIPSSSMVPNLLFRDFLIVLKWPYGYSRYSLTGGSIIPYFQGRISLGKPQGPGRGDVVVFSLPSDPGTSYVKRVVGLPGDRIRVQDGVLWINGQPCTLERAQSNVVFPISDLGPNVGSALKGDLYYETFPGESRRHVILKQNPFGQVAQDNTPEYLVPEHHYFMMGDNRDNSTDSRFTDVGMVHQDYLIGRAARIYFSTRYPVDMAWWEVWRWLPTLPWNIRYDRMFQEIQ